MGKRATYDPKSASVAYCASKLCVSDPLHSTLNDWDADPELAGEDRVEWHGSDTMDKRLV